MEKTPVFSIIMPSYNAQDTIEMALKSIRMQDFDQERIEILVIDGGSRDDTVNIAERYGAIVLPNPDRLPEFAKRIGFLQARGAYAIRMDTDEEFLSVTQLSQRYRLLSDNPKVVCLLANRSLSPEGFGISNRYLNLYGDPFTLFVYKSKGSVLATFRRSIVSCRGKDNVLFFRPEDVKPIGDSGTTLFSMRCLRERYAGELGSVRFAATAFERVITDSGFCGCISGDDIMHYSAASLKTYLAKLRFRVINNIFRQDESGFSARTATSPALARRKRLFVLYALSVLLPLYDSVRLALRQRDARMLLHFFYVYYVCALIAWYLVQKRLGRKKANTSYGKE